MGFCVKVNSWIADVVSENIISAFLKSGFRLVVSKNVKYFPFRLFHFLIISKGRMGCKVTIKSYLPEVDNLFISLKTSSFKARLSLLLNVEVINITGRSCFVVLSSLKSENKESILGQPVSITSKCLYFFCCSLNRSVVAGPCV